MKRLFISLLTFVSITSFAKETMPYNLQRGLEAIQNNQIEEGLEYLEKEIKENPKNGYAYMLIASIREDRKEHGKALSYADLAIKNLSKKEKKALSTTYMTRGCTYAGLEDTVKALADYEMSIKLNPENNEAYEKRGQIYYEKKKYDLADADYKQLIKLDQSSVMGYMGIGRNRNGQKKWDEAIAQFDYVAKMYPNYSDVYSFRAESYLGKKDWDNATDDIVSALRIDNNSKAFYIMQNLEETPFTKLKAKFQINASKEANDPSWPYYNGVIHEYKCQYQQAVRYYEEANNRDMSSGFLERISICYFKIGQFETCLDVINKALNMDPKNVSLLTRKANTLYQLDRKTEELAQWDSILAISPDYANAYYYRGKTKKYMNDNDGALEDYSMAITIDPKQSFYYNARGYLYSKIGKNSLANDDYKKVIELEKKTGHFQCSHYAYLTLGNSEKAVEVMDSIISKDTLYAGAYYDAACLYARMNRLPEALHYLEVSFEKGYRNFTHIKNDYDMDPLRESPEFKAMINKYKEMVKDGKPVSEKTSSDAVEVVEIPFVKDNGSNLCNVKCTINELPLSFIFDTGASIVSLSQVEATFMMKNGYLSKNDVVGDSYYSDANGNVSVGTVINLKKVVFGDLTLSNVRASVVQNQKAPLLLGQSVLGRLGKIEIDNSKHVLRISKN